MNLVFTTTDSERRAAVTADPTLNGIDMVEIVDADVSDGASRTLLLRCFRDVSGLAVDNLVVVGVAGPDSETAIEVARAVQASTLSGGPDPDFSDEERARFASIPTAANVLVVRIASPGDFPSYLLSLVQSQSDSTPPGGFDPPLASIVFALRIETAARVQYRCGDDDRRQLVEDSPHLNGIDFLEVVDREHPVASLRQRTLLLRCFKPVAEMTADNIAIDGGVRITPVRALWAFPADAVPAALAGVPERTLYATLPEPDHVLVVRTDSSGDFSTYTLSVVQSPDNSSPLLGFDPRLSTIEFTFKAECPSEFDCAPKTSCAPEPSDEPNIDYLAKDYASFRRLMLDRLAITMPSWQERNAADVQVALVELLAYVGDHLSYYQDAVATEAYLGTARKRTSIRRHARLLDYRMHDGANARTWVFIEVEPGGGADGMTLPTGTGLLSGDEDGGTTISAEEASKRSDETIFFETIAPITLRASHNEMSFYTWSDGDCCLPTGATRATLRHDAGIDLRTGDVLMFEEVIGPDTGAEADADRDHRHPVVLTGVTYTFDPLDGTPIVNIEWGDDDRLPFPLCISSRLDDTNVLTDVSIARGNIVLADHGRTVVEDLTATDVPGDREFRYRLGNGPLTFRDVPKKIDSARAATARDLSGALPDITLSQSDLHWTAQRDLLASDRFAPDFVVETESDGSAYLRFGDGTHGREVDAATTIEARYRVGNGKSGNVGIGAIGRVVTGVDGISAVRNPLPATGGVEPESEEQVRQFAPEAFRVQERAVTEEDYVEMAERHPDVQKAAATFRWTGSWYTAFVTIDRTGGRTVDEAFRQEMTEYLERFRIVGHDLEINGPTFVPLDLRLKVCVRQGYFREDVKQALLRAFSNGAIGRGKRGFFHPDNFTFGQSLYLSRIYSAALDVPGVSTVEVTRMQRWGKSAAGEIAAGLLRLGPLEVIRLDNDPNAPENGKIEFEMGGGI